VKILIVSDAWHPQVNGVVRTLQHTIKVLRSIGHSVEMITPDQFRSVPCPSYGEIRLALATPRMIGRRIELLSPDAIHIATEGPLGLCARRACTKRGLTFTSAYHTQFPEYVSLRTGLPAGPVWAYVRWFHSAAHQVLTATPTLACQLAAHGIAQTTLWSRGVDMHQFRAGLAPPAEMRGHPGPVQLYVGRVAVEKNIEAFLSCEHPGTKVVIGDGPARAALQQKYPNALFLGARTGEALAAAYAAADVFVFPSRTDTFGLVMLEALACGTPVAGFPVQGPLDVVGADGCGMRAGFSTRVGALHADLAEAITQALTCDRQACQAYARLFDWHSCAAAFVKALMPTGDAPRASVPSLPLSGTRWV
jgi:glycosyltransferase involved in cell wall biosynthesis